MTAGHRTNGVRDVIVIGSGPAAYTAALYAARAALSPLVFEGSVDAGGALMTATDVENFPGFRHGILGPDLMAEMRAQAERFDAELVADDVVSVDLTGDVKRVATATDTFFARSVVLAMGAGYRKLGIPGEERLSGHGVSFCATCDGFFFRGKDVAVVGGGDTAIEEALFLTRFASSVTIVHRRAELRASKVMQQRALSNNKVEFAWNRTVVSALGEERLSGVEVQDVNTGETAFLKVSGLFVAIGHDPRSELVAHQLELDRGYVRVNHPSTRTSSSGVFACGDLVDRHYRQAVTAAGTGCAAALDAERYIAERDHRASSAGEFVAAVADLGASEFDHVDPHAQRS